MKCYGALGLLLLLGACAHAPQVSVLRRAPASLPVDARFELVGDDPADQAVGSALAARGFRVAARGEAGDLVVQAALAQKPRAVGALVPTEAGDPQWLTRDDPARLWSLNRRTYVLSVAIHDRQGRELFRSAASQSFRKQATVAALPTLAKAAVEPLSAQAATLPGG